MSVLQNLRHNVEKEIPSESYSNLSEIVKLKEVRTSISSEGRLLSSTSQSLFSQSGSIVRVTLVLYTIPHIEFEEGENGQFILGFY